MNTIYDGSYMLGSTSALTFEAGPGIVIDEPSAGTVRIGNDETVLWSGTYGSTALSLSESPLNFSTIKVYYGGHNNNASGQNSYYGCAEFEPVINGTTAQYMPINSTFIGALGTNTMYEVYTMWSGVNTTEWERIYYAWKNITGTSWNTGSNWQSVYKVVGINRIGGNE